MALHYAEFDTTQQNLYADLRTEILKSSDWTRLGSADTVILTTTVAIAAGATTLTFASTTVPGLAVNSVIRIDNGASREYRTVTAMAATTLTIAATSFAQAIRMLERNADPQSQEASYKLAEQLWNDNEARAKKETNCY